jgi:hypothetical protein
MISQAREPVGQDGGNGGSAHAEQDDAGQQRGASFLRDRSRLTVERAGAA